jgi:cobyrinic acid a,c-diamide synthase
LTWSDALSYPRVLVAGLRGGGGKTLVSLGLVAAWHNNGRKVAPFKKGPDYIDAAWLSAAAGEPCRNMDLFLMSRQGVLSSLETAAEHTDVAVIEGNRGLFDGMDAEGSYSSAELAKLLSSPIVLTVDCTKSTRTVAALILGCLQLDPDAPIRGVVLNQIAGSRHEAVIRAAVEQSCGIPVLGVIPKLRKQIFPERHLGLVPPQEHDEKQAAILRVAEVGEQYLDLDAFWSLAQTAPELEHEKAPVTGADGPKAGAVEIGVFRDAAFQFYYPENLEALVHEGATLIEISPLVDAELPDLDALYIGGGFPETLAPTLSGNKQFRESLRTAIERGLPVYAECGGAVYLGKKLIFESREYPMVDVLPVVFGFQEKPQGHGYVKLETVGENPFFSIGQPLRGHEFHYTKIESCDEGDLTFAFKVSRGFGFDGERDGMCRYNVLASYTHVHALGTDIWAPSVVRAALRFKECAKSASDNSAPDLSPLAQTEPLK